MQIDSANARVAELEKVERGNTWDWQSVSSLPLVHPSPMFDAMKTLTTREFFHSPGLVKALRSGHSILVTENGKPALVVTKVGKRPRRTRAQLEREAKEICPEPTPKVDFTSAL